MNITLNGDKTDRAPRVLLYLPQVIIDLNSGQVLSYKVFFFDFSIPPTLIRIRIIYRKLSVIADEV